MDTKAATRSGKKTGTTVQGTAGSGIVPAYAEVVRVDTRGCGVQGKLVANIKNLTAGTSVYWKIDGYPYDVDGTLSGTAVAVKAATELAAGTLVTSTDVDKGYAAVVISIRGGGALGGGTAADYSIEYTTY